jgi:hypothetical protein
MNTVISINLYLLLFMLLANYCVGTLCYIKFIHISWGLILVRGRNISLQQFIRIGSKTNYSFIFYRYCGLFSLR